MKKNYITFALLLALIIIPKCDIICQNKISHKRLFGECKDGIGSYICQQILIKKNNRFKFYDYLHLRGGIVNEGDYERVNDTLFLTTDKVPKIEIKYGVEQLDTVVIKITNKGNPLGFSRIYSDEKAFESDTSGVILLPTEKLDSIFTIDAILIGASGKVLIENRKMIQKIIIDFEGNFHILENTVFMIREKWIIKENKIFYPNYKCEYDEERFFKETSIENKKF